MPKRLYESQTSPDESQTSPGAKTLTEAMTAVSDHKARSGTLVDADPGQAAQFISDMLLELRNISYQAKLTQLTYFLEMAFYEAFEQTAKVAPRPGKRLKPKG